MGREKRPEQQMTIEIPEMYSLTACARVQLVKDEI